MKNKDKKYVGKDSEEDEILDEVEENLDKVDIPFDRYYCPHCNYELLGEQKMFATCPYCMQFIQTSDFGKDNEGVKDGIKG